MSDHRMRVGRERSERTQARILRAALQVFADQGPDAPKIDDVVAAAGISRGTFYNYFDSVDALLAATCAWTTRESIESIEEALAGVEGPALRYGLGLRLFFARARSDPTWSRFVGRVWRVDGLELPDRDLDEGLDRGVFRAASPTAMRDLVRGGVREALLRIGTERTAPEYGDHLTELCLQALGTDPRLIAAVMEHELPEGLEEDESP